MKKTMILAFSCFSLLGLSITASAEECPFIGTDQYRCATYLCPNGCVIVICPGDPAILDC